MDVGAQKVEGFFAMTIPSMLKLVVSFLIFSALVSCQSSALKYEKSGSLELSPEFDQSVKITEAKPATTSSSNTDSATSAIATSNSAGAKPTTGNSKSKGLKSAKSGVEKSEAGKSNSAKGGTEKSPKTKAVKEHLPPVETAKALKHEPDLEDGQGFLLRRPVKDPFRVGELVTHEVSYFGVTAGTLTLKVEPFVQVNDRNSYKFVTEIKTAGTFSAFYTADDRAETLVDFETLTPNVFSLHVKESGQLREAKAHFDPKELKATYWEKKYTKKDGEEEKKLKWDILEYSQNVFSAIFYMRVFQWEVGKEYSFRVADDGENIVFKAKALRKEVLKTDAGAFPCVVIKPEILVKGAFRPVGDIYFWMTDDDRKLVLRIESKIKIGTLVSEAIKIERGAN